MPEFSSKKFLFVNYALTALIVAASLFLIRQIIEISLSKNETQTVSRSAKKPIDRILNKKNIMNYAAILEKNPFGPPLKLSPIAGGKAGETSMDPISNLMLVGTAVGPKELSYAVFIDKSAKGAGSQDVFTYGENVFNYGTLVKIGTSSVEIEQNAVNYTVEMPAEQSVPVNEAAHAAGSDESELQFARQVSDSQYILDSTKVQQSLENPEQILTDARLLPNIVDGRQEGFKISEVVDDGLYHSLGLRNGDVLLKINGLEISNPEVAIQAMSALKSMNRVELDIRRGNANMSMSYQIR